MSGPLGSSQWMYASGDSFYDYNINQSLRCNGSNEYLTRTPSSAGNTQTWTFSAWVKLGVDGIRFPLIEAYSNGTNFTMLNVHTDGRILFYNINSAVDYGGINTQRLRDPSAWYHIVFRVDTTQSTAADRLRLYVNGEQQETNPWTTYGQLPQNYGTFINYTVPNHIIKNTNSNQYGQGYIAEVHHIDGTSYGPDTFAETKNGVWVPKEVSGVSYGTNGFYLDFADSSDIGNNANTTDGTNDFTVNNFTASDVVPDSPANVFPVLNPLQVSSNITLAEGNLKSTTTNTASSHQSYSTMNIPTSGKWYFECYAVLPRADDLEFGIAELPTPDDRNANHLTTQLYNASADACAILNNSAGNLSIRQQSGTGILASSITGSTGDIYQIAFDCDTGKVFLGRNNTYYRVGAADGDPASGTNPSKTITANKEYFVGLSCYGGNGAGGGIINYGQDSTFAGNKTAGGNADANGIGDFAYAPPSGFLALCTANLPEPTIGPNSNTTSNEHFDTVLYTAATSNGTYTHGNLAFRPDFSWIKNRNNVERHFLIDVVRGNTSVTDKFLVSNATSTEGANGVAGTTFSVTDTGYEFVETSISSGELYYNGRTYVGWNWKAGGTAVSNTDGTITSSVSANQDAGFSIVTYTGVGTAGSTYGHGLASAPELIITKGRETAYNWTVYHSGIAADAETDYLVLDSTNAAADLNTVWNDTAPTNSVITVGNFGRVNANNQDYVSYCFHSVDGFSKVGSYVGNASTDGPFIYTGFRPAFVLLKVSSGTTNNWHILDNKRNTYNFVNLFLNPNDTSAEVTFTFGDFVSNGFRITNTGGSFNTNAATYIYLAFAEAPFKYANAR